MNLMREVRGRFPVDRCSISLTKIYPPLPPKSENITGCYWSIIGDFSCMLDLRSLVESSVLPRYTP